ncbi:MAG: hypothetical protein ABIR71_10740 [Chthoniobacterales bacterium]
MKRAFHFAAALTIALISAPGADAKVASQSASGFLVTHEADVAFDPKGACDAFVNIGRGGTTLTPFRAQLETFRSTQKRAAVGAKYCPMADRSDT